MQTTSTAIEAADKSRAATNPSPALFPFPQTMQTRDGEKRATDSRAIARPASVIKASAEMPDSFCARWSIARMSAERATFIYLRCQGTSERADLVVREV